MLFFKPIYLKIGLNGIPCHCKGLDLVLRKSVDRVVTLKFVSQRKRSYKSELNMSGDSKHNLGGPKPIELHNDLKIKVSDMRTKYLDEANTFLESDLQSKDPIEQFRIWFEEAMRTPGISEPNAMCVATASKDGRPSARFLLLKGFGKEGFKFYTNYNSRKGQDLEENPWAALTFYWEALHRSVRVEGHVEKLPESDSDEYFHSRPRDSQIGACVSDQSHVIESRAVLTAKQKELEALYDGKELPKPENWGGYIVVPESIEFWQGQSNRIHDRIRFRRQQPGEVLDSHLTHAGDNGWLYERLAP